MLHGVDIRNGRALYTNKWVLSKRLQQDKSRGFSVYNMGALNAGDLSATLDERVMDSNGRLYGRMNTNVS
jgi:carotenoid cleavage dioxygenase-like enzyme